MYGREARLPIDLTRGQNEDDDDDCEDDIELEVKVQRMLSLQKQLHDKARSNIEKAQARHKQQYDAKHNTNTTIKVGDRVLVKSMKNVGRKGGKLEPLFPGGPYEVAEDLGKGRFRLKDADGKVLKTAMNVHRLKIWNNPDECSLKEDDVSKHHYKCYEHAYRLK